MVADGLFPDVVPRMRPALKETVGQLKAVMLAVIGAVPPPPVSLLFLQETEIITTVTNNTRSFNRIVGCFLFFIKLA